MTRAAIRAVLVGLLCWQAGDARAEELRRLPLHLHKPGERILAITGQGKERRELEQLFAGRMAEIEIVENFDETRTDYSGIYAIIAGSNALDRFKDKTPNDFRHVVQFVEDGGHLFFFGSFNGRFFNVAAPLGIQTRAVHGYDFELVPNRSDALFFGYDDILPKDRKLRSFAYIKISRPHISMLTRGEGGGYTGETKLASWCYGRGRVSATMVEPYTSGPWIVPVVADWVRRGAPTTLADVVDSAAVDPITYLQNRELSGMILPESEIALLRKDMRAAAEKLSIDQSDLARHHLEQAEAETDLNRKPIHYLVAAEQAAKIGDLEFAFDALDKAAEVGYVKKPEIKATLLEGAVESADEVHAHIIAQLALDQIPALTELYRYDIAVRFAELAAQAAAKARDDRLEELAEKSFVEVSNLRTQLLAHQELIQRWSASPTDPDVLEEVGRFLAFTMNDWELGLECLASGDNAVLSNLAAETIDLPDDPTLRVRIGDRWRKLADELDELEKENIRRYVRQLYQQLGQQLRLVAAADRRRVVAFLDSFPSEKATLSLRVVVDGYGLLTVTHEAATWETKAGLEPESIEINKQIWTPVDESFANYGSKRFLPSGVDLSTASVSKVKGRGLVRLISRTADKITLRFNDIPTDESEYIVNVTFGD